MARKRQDLVFEGNQIKARLLADRTAYKTPVHVDWLRFTIPYKKAPTPTADDLFCLPLPSASVLSELPQAQRESMTARTAVKELPPDEVFYGSVAKTVADDVCTMLGPDFFVSSVLNRGQDFYKYRWSITRGGAEVAWVGFLASSDSKKQSAQKDTIHVNLHGAACTFADRAWRQKMAEYIDRHEAKITRVDLALDFFGGIKGGMLRIKSDYESGVMDHLGKCLTCNMHGPWVDGGRGRSFYLGSKEAGKQTNIYEKGVQLFGEKDATNWERIELRYGNKLRVISSDILKRPADFFAGASDWHAQMLQEHGLPESITPEKLPCKGRLPAQTVKAEVVRVFRWLRDVAGPSISFAFQHLPDLQLVDLTHSHKLPGRLERFQQSDLVQGVADAFRHITAPGTRAPGHGLQLAH